jgi:hypothetical protein
VAVTAARLETTRYVLLRVLVEQDSSVLIHPSHPDATATTDAAVTAQAEATAPVEAAEDDPAHPTTATDRAATRATPTHILPADVIRSANGRIGTVDVTGGRRGNGTVTVATVAAAIAGTAVDAAGAGVTMTGPIDGADATSLTTVVEVAEEMVARLGVEAATTSSRRCAVRPGAGPRRLPQRRSASPRRT